MKKIILFLSFILLIVSCDNNQENAAKLEMMQFDAILGCMNDTMFNHLLYADDIVLIAPSASALQLLLNLCEDYAQGHDILYNFKKLSACVSGLKSIIRFLLLE
mgnify:CR=1 FL=1